MAKELNEYQVRLTFDANTEKAKKQLKDLQQQLQSLATGSGAEKLNFSDEIAKASKAAAELSAHLSQATNQKTGTLDFTRLNDSIKKSGQSLANYGEQLLKLGPSGQQAFQKLATAVSNSEIPVRRISNTLREMGTVLKNTIKWQISSSAIHSFMGAVQSAYGYAQDLNESLNNIRIVTGQNIEQMERFAATANKAAKALSASTLDYTDAALIYYQQGLSDEEVKARTDVTVKMANVTGETAEKVSQQLTAVWNNFAKGSDNLEYFADVMTALGAATASSTDEISAGLEKFSAVAETVGLSYEYATAALATVTATTRQSADVVGNAFKTIFARLEGLKLGETLEDDTDLNKYSAALHNVGVEIKNTDRSLKDMDTILDELSSRWQTLSRDQQMALAQTVAGVRQYNTLISLMNNWDFMKENLETARNASGTLQEQADIYAESWEAAQKRVKAAAEGIYQSLLDDDFFITMLNGAEHVLDTINSLIKSLGGIPGVLSLIGNVFSRVFEKQIIQGLQNTAYNLQTLTASGRAKVAQEKQNAENAMLGLMPTVHMTEQDFGTHAEDNTRTLVMKEINDLQLTLNKNADKYNEIQLMTNQSLLEQKKIQGEKVVATGVQRDKVSIETGAGISDYMTRIRGSGILNEESQQIFDQRGSRLQNHILQSTFLKEFQKQFKEAQKSGTDFNLVLEKTQRILSRYSDQKSLNYFQELEKKFKEGKISAENYEQELEQLIQKTEKAIKYNSEGMMDQVNENLPNTEAGWIEGLQQEEDYTENFIGNAQRRAEAIRDNVFANDDFHESNERMKEDFNVVSQNYATWSSNLVQGAQAVMGLASSITMITGIMDSLWDGIANGTLTVKDVIANITTLGMLIPTILTGLNGLKSIEEGLRLAREAKNLATEKNITLEQAKHILDMKAAGVLPSKIAAYEAEAVAQNQVNTAEAANTPITAANAAAWYAHPIMWIAAVIMAVVVAISAISKAQEEHTKKLKENAEEAKRVADEYHKIVDEHQNLANSFYKQIALYQETHEITNELIDSTLKLADAYGVQDARLKILQGRYKEVLSIIQMARQNELAEENEQLSNELNEEYELVKNSSTYKQTVVNSGPYAHATDGKMFIDPNGDQEYLDAITGLYGKSGFENIISSSYGNQQYYRFNLDLSTPEQFLKTYKNVETIVEKSLKLSADRGTEVGSATQSLQDFLVEYKESYDQLLETTNAIDDNKIETTILDNIIGKDINTIQNFHDISQRVIDDLGNTEEAAKKVHQYFLDNPLYSEFAANDELLSSAAKQAGLKFEEILDIYNSLPDEQKSIFFTIDFRKYKTEEAIREQLENMQAIADANSVYVELNTTSNAIKKLKANMTEEEYAAYKNDSGINWGENGVANYNEFLTLGYKQQKSYLQNILEKQRRDLIPSTIEGINGTLAEIDYNNELKAQHQANIQPAINQASYFQGLGDNYWAEQFTQLAEFETSKVNELTEANDGLNTKLQEQEEQLSNAIYSYASTATSLNDLNQITEVFNQSLLTNEEYQHAVDNALQSIAEQYDTCSDELDAFTFALTTQSDELITAARNTLEYSIHTAELAEKMGLSVDDIEDQARAFREEEGGIKALISDGEELTKVSTTMASLNQSMNKGVAALTKNWDTWKKTLSTSEKTSMDYIDTIQELRTVLKDLTGVLDEDFIPKGFFDAPEVMELMDKAAQGDAKSINLLGTALAKSSIEAKEFKNGMNAVQAAIDAGVSTDNFDPFRSSQETFDYYKNNVLEGIENLNQAILNGTIQAGENITSLMNGTGASWVDSLNAMAMATGMSVDEMNSLLNELGVETEVKTVPHHTQVSVPVYRTEMEDFKQETDENGNPIPGAYSYTSSTRQIDTKEMDGVIDVAQINVGDKIGSSPKITYAGRSTPSTASTTSSSKSGGGGGSKSSQKKKKSDVERYHEIKSTIKDLTTEYDRLDKAKNRAFGEGKFRYISDEITKTKQLIEANKEYINQIKNWQSIDIERANQVAKRFGFEEFDDQTNWTDIQYKLIDYYNANILNSEDEELKEGYENWIKYIQQVIDTHELLNNTIDEGTELANRLQDLVFEDYTARIELRVELQEKSRKIIESKLNVLGDSFYKKVEAAYLLLEDMDINYNETQGLSLAGAQQNFDQLEDDMVYAKNLFDQGEISADQAHDAFNTVFDSALATANDLASLNDEFKTYYREALDQAKEDIAWLEKGFSNITDQLDHYKKLLDLTGQTKAYDKQLVILQTQLSVAEDQLKVHKDQAKTAKADYERMLEFYNSLDDAGKAQYEDQLRAQKDYLDELDAAVREDTERIAEYAQEILTTSLEQIYDAYEKSLTNGAGFDYLNQIMDLAAEKADLVLTKTNQIYETNKMIHNLDRDIEKTNNQYAKTRLSNFKSEIKELKEKGELTHYELEDAQLRYEILKAQIALEEAQNAKSTVRLQRDNEGNFGYVYTTDRENVAQAQDNLDKALNDRYNHALKAQEDFQRQYYNAEKEFEDALRVLNEQRMSGEISEETYQKRVLEIKKYYLPILSSLEENNLAALEDMNETSTEHINDSWTRMFNENGYGLKGKTKEWEDSTITAVGSVDEAFQEWQKTIDKDIEPEVTTDLDTLTKKTQDLKTESKNLRIEISEKFHSIVKPLLDDISDITGAWARQETQIQNLITKYQNLATAAQENIQKVNDAQRATYTAYASDGSTYTIHSETGVHFIESSKKGDTLQGGDQSSWVNLGNGAVKITTKNGKEYLYGSLPQEALQDSIADSTTNPVNNQPVIYTPPSKYNEPSSSTVPTPRPIEIDQTTANRVISSQGSLAGVLGMSAASMMTIVPDNTTVESERVNINPGIVTIEKPGTVNMDTKQTGNTTERQAMPMASGGYTGSWGPEGKMAMLHEKELVLNKDDTANFLAGINILRQITDAIDLQALSMSAAAGVALPSLDNQAQALEQTVTITAEFPNVSNHLEIEEAFNNLVNRASQYANRF